MRWILFLLATLSFPPTLVAAEPLACRLCDSATPSVGDAAPTTPVALEVATTLDFDRVILTGPAGGIARLGPDGSRSTSGALATMTGRAEFGEVVVRGEPGRALRIGMPERIDLHGFSGGNLSITRVTSDLPTMPRLDGSGRLRFRFGGELFVSGDAEGNYRGDVDIIVEYL